MTSKIDFFLFLCFSFSCVQCIIYQRADPKWVSFIASMCCTYLYIFAFVQLSRLVAGAEDTQQKLHLFCFILHRGLLYCVTAELKGGICDLISPGNIKEKRCFIHRRKAPEFAQIKFARLCLRDQAWGLTRIEMIGFLRVIKNKIKSQKERRKLWAWERRLMFEGGYRKQMCF